MASMWFRQGGKTSALGYLCKIFAVLALSKVCVAHDGNVHIESSESHDNWYLAGATVTLVCAWEGFKTLVSEETPGGESSSPSQSRVAREETDSPKPEMISSEVQTEEASESQLEELLRTRTKQAQTIPTLQGIIGKKNHDLQAIRNWRPTANAVGTVYFCPEGTVWHASELCARNRAGGRLIA